MEAAGENSNGKTVLSDDTTTANTPKMCERSGVIFFYVTEIFASVSVSND